MKKYIIISILVLASVIGKSQNNWCGFSPRTSDIETYKSRVSNIFANRSNQLRPDCLNKTLSVHIHLIGENSDDSYAEIDSITIAFDSLNVAFEPICLSFEICKTEYHYNSVYFEDLIDTNYSKVYKLYADTGVINVFYIDSFDDSEIEGLSLPAPENFFALSTTNFKVLIHEMGHYLGLLHTHNGGDELVDRSNCNIAGDFLCDTPADPGLDSCNYVYGPMDANGDYYTPPIYNHMSYSGHECRKEFTPMQFMVMIDCILNVRTYLH